MVSQVAIALLTVVLVLSTLTQTTRSTAAGSSNLPTTHQRYQKAEKLTRTVDKRTVTQLVCSSQELNSIFEACKESVKPANESISKRFCGGDCKSLVAAYAQECNYSNFSLNVTGTCLVNYYETQCIFAVILIRPGISFCSASAVSGNNGHMQHSNNSLLCSLSTSHNTTGDHYRIEFDSETRQLAVKPSLEPPWDNCSDYYNKFGHPLPVYNKKRTVPTDIECSSDHLDDIIRGCEESVQPTNSSSISRLFCGANCRSRVIDYASACNYTDFSLNVTGACQINTTQLQCIFAVIIVRPGISSCLTNAVNDNQLAVTDIDASDMLCCSLTTSVNTTGDFHTIRPDPGTGQPTIFPPLLPPWQNCSAYASSIAFVCESEPTPVYTSPTTNHFTLTNNSTRTTILTLSTTSSVSLLHATFHHLLIAFIFVIVNSL